MPKQNQELQQKYIELQYIIQQINQVQQQIIAIQTQLLELRNLRENLNKLDTLKPNTESIIPLGYNIYTKANLKNTKELLVNVGSNIVVEKTINETNELIDEQIKEIEQILNNLQAQLNGLELKGQSLQEELAELMPK